MAPCAGSVFVLACALAEATQPHAQIAAVAQHVDVDGVPALPAHGLLVLVELEVLDRRHA